MCYFKKATAMLLALIMLLSVAMCANAATSPAKAPDASEYHRTDAKDNTDLYAPPEGAHVAYNVAGGDAVCTAVSAYAPNSTALITTAIGTDGKIHAVEKLGNGKNGIANIVRGENVTGITVDTIETLVVATKALSGSYVNTVILKAPKVVFQKNVCKGTNAKSVIFDLTSFSKANQITFKGNAFKGAKKVTIKLSKANMTKKQYLKLKKKIKSKNKGVKLKFLWQ